MARKPPAEVRALHEHWRPAVHVRDLPGLSHRGRLAVARLERRRFWPGAAAEAYDVLVAYIRDPFHPRWRPDYWCGVSGCCTEITERREVLDAAVRVLPPPDALPFKRCVADFDELG